MADYCQPDNLVYLDHAALSPLLPELERQTPVQALASSLNPHAGNHFSEQVLSAIREGERKLLARLGTSEFESELLWTSGGTEANNLAVLGCLRTLPKPLSIIDGTAHKALLEPARAHAGAEGRCIETMADREGQLRWSEVEGADADTAALVGVCHVNNETGAMQDLVKLRAWLDRRAPNAVLMVDAMQSFGKMKIPWTEARIDLLSIGGRKIGGPPQVGALIVRRGTPLQPLMFGGGQQRGYRPGTLDAGGILGFLRAADQVCEGQDEHWRHIRNLNLWLRRQIQEDWDGPVPTIVSPSSGSPYILCLAFTGFEGAILVRALARQRVIVGSGSACSSESAAVSHVLLAMGMDQRTGRGQLRVSFSPQTSQEEVAIFVRKLRQALEDY